jgi:hypothetical protein
MIAFHHSAVGWVASEPPHPAKTALPPPLAGHYENPPCLGFFHQAVKPLLPRWSWTFDGVTMRVLLIFCHPRPDSFSAALRDAAVDGLTSSGHSVELRDLYAEAFDPVLSAHQSGTYFDEAESVHGVEDHVAALRRAEGLVLVYPTWWFGMPAMLKGWLDRAWLPGVGVPPGWSEDPGAVADEPPADWDRNDVWLAPVATLVGRMAGPARGQARLAPAVRAGMPNTLAWPDAYGRGQSSPPARVFGQGQTQPCWMAVVAGPKRGARGSGSQDLQQMAIGILEIETPAMLTMVDRHVLG